MRPRGWGWADAAPLALLALFTALHVLGRWHGQVPFVFLGGDAGNIASYAAALDHPDAFAGDGALSDPGRLAFYRTLHVPFLRALTPLTGDYGTSFVVLLGIQTALLGLGWYALGRALLRSRFWAGCLAALNLAHVPLNVGTYWGPYPDAVPRTTFAALLPFLLLAALRWRDQPRRWPWLMVAAALGLYVHPVGAPAWALALWLGCALHALGTGGPRRAVLVGAGLAAVFLVAGADFVASYAGSSAAADRPVDPAALYAAMRRHLPDGLFDVRIALRGFLETQAGWPALYWVGAAAGIGVLLRLGGRPRRLLPLVGAWTAGVLVVALGLPALEQGLHAATGRAPLQVDFVRNLRFLVPLMLLLVVWPAAELQRRGLPRSVAPGGAWAAVGVALTAGWLVLHPPQPALDALRCLARGRVSCPPPGWFEAREALAQARSRSAAGDRFLSTQLALPLRYWALRPVAHDFRDHGVLLYADRASLGAWARVEDRVVRVRSLRGPARRLAGLREIGRDVGARFLLVDATYLPRARAPGLVWRNQVWGIVEVDGAAHELPEPPEPR